MSRCQILDLKSALWRIPGPVKRYFCLLALFEIPGGDGNVASCIVANSGMPPVRIVVLRNMDIEIVF